MTRIVKTLFIIIFVMGCVFNQNTQINIGILNRPLSLKSYEIRDGVSTIVGHQIHRGLLNYHHETGQIVGYAAKDWQYSADYKSLIFNLDTALKFHDGAYLTCDAILNSFNTLLKNKNSTSIKFPKTIKFKCIDNKFIMSMNKIPTTIFETLASPAASISKGENSDIGIGPYKLASVSSNKIVLENVINPRNILNFIIDKRDTLVKLFIDGKVDDLIYLGLFEDLNLDCKKIISYTPTTFWLNLNTDKLALKDKKTRNLLQFYFDMGFEKSHIFKNENKLNGLIPYGVLGYNQVIKAKLNNLDFLQIQKKLIHQTSKTNKIRLTLRKANKSMYEWDKLINLLDPDQKIFEVEYLDNQTFFKKYYNNDLSLFFLGANITRNDPFEVFSFFRHENKVNPASVKEDQISKLEELYNQSTSLSERKLLAKKANEWLLSQGYIIPLFSKKLSGCVSKKLKGISISPVGPLMIDYSRVEKE